MTKKPISPRHFAAVIGVLVCIAVVAFSILYRAKEHHVRSANSWTEFLALLKESNTGLIKVRSGDNWIFWASPEAEGIFGYGPDEMSGLPLNKIMSQELAYAHEEKMYKSMLDAKDPKLAVRLIPVECKAVKKDGTMFNIVLRIMIGDESVFVIVNKESETKFIPLNKHPSDEQKKVQQRFDKAGSR
jgi:PAS domain S-box-containing protein